MVKVQSHTLESEVVIPPELCFFSEVTFIEEHILTVVLEQTNSVQPEPHTDVADEVVNMFVPNK